VEQGRALYSAQCLTCHGDETGQKRQFDAPPHNAEGHTWHHPDRLLFQWVLDGPPLKTTMPTFRGKLSEQEVASVLAFIKTMWPEEIQSSQRDSSQAYEDQLRELGQ
jgi:mono/diheme cytochrome c family protein